MSRVVKGLEGEKDETFAENGKGEWLGVESRMLLEEARLRLAIEVVTTVDRYKEMRGRRR